MKEQEKYYTPTIEEFYVGFEYEALNSNEWLFQESEFGWKNILWEPRLVSQNMFIENIYLAILKKWIRVKYLDKEDIESLGWKFYASKEEFDSYDLSTGDDLKNTKENQWNLRQSKKSNKLYIHQGTNWVRFFGTIKNKSELKRLMLQLGI